MLKKPIRFIKKLLNIRMRIYEIITTKPLTPKQAHINALKQQKVRANTALKAERDRQKKAKATEKLQQAQQTLAKLQSD